MDGRTDGHGETSIPPYFEMVEHYIIGCKEKSILEGFGEGLV
jgi:hypothetical protein